MLTLHRLWTEILAVFDPAHYSLLLNIHSRILADQKLGKPGRFDDVPRGWFFRVKCQSLIPLCVPFWPWKIGNIKGLYVVVVVVIVVLQVQSLSVIISSHMSLSLRLKPRWVGEAKE